MRKLMWFAIGFAGACAIGAYFYNSWLLPLAMICLVLAGVSFLLRLWKIGFRVVCAIFLGAAVGFGCFNVYNSLVLQKAHQFDGKTQNVIIEVADYSYSTDRGCAFDGSIVIGNHTYKVRAYLNNYVALVPGHQVQGDFQFQVTFWNGDDSLNHAGKGIFLFAYQKGECIISENSQQKWSHYPTIWRNELKTMVGKLFPGDTEGFARAILLGDTTGIDYETDMNLKVSGIRHVIAVSGLHVSIVFAFLYLLAGKKRMLTALIGIPTVILFAALAGFTPSVTRACIMQILMMLALLFEKEYDPPTALAFAVLIMLGINPMTIGSVSFQLSVSCMIGIFLFADRINNWLINSTFLSKRKEKHTAWITGPISISLSTMIITTPLSACYFGTVSLIGIVTNLIALWAITAVFYGVMFVCTLGYIVLPVARFIGSILAWLIRYVKLAASVLASIPLSAVYTKSIYIVIWLVFAYVLLTVYLLLKKKPAVLFSSLLICGLCASLAFSWTEPLMDKCRVTMLDVGQGQAILLQSEGKTFLVDCGGDYDKGAANVTAETLLSQGIRKIDGVILTHYDRDHAGGIPYLLTRVSAENLFLPFATDTDGMQTQLQDISDATVHTVIEDVKLGYGDAEMTIFAPVSYNSGNESSMCVLFRTENCDILIIGDRSEKTERILVSRYDLPELDVLVAGHHGSHTSTSLELLEETRPEYAFISVGEGNHYGHPAQQTINRLLQFGCEILRTDENGTVIFRR